MKKNIILLLFLILCCSNLCFYCETDGYNDVCILVVNETSDTINVTLNLDEGWVAKLDKMLPSTLEVHYYSDFWERNNRINAFNDIVVNDLRNKHFVVTSLSGDTLANWNDNSKIFTDTRYWTKETSIFGTNMEYSCTLTITDEALKIK